MNLPHSQATALTGIRVADMTQALAGPYLAMLLGDLGADVIKIERPGIGDQSRGWGPPFVGSESTYFMSVNRNKRSFTCDLKAERGLEALQRLLDTVDVIITNERRREYRVRMGIDYDGLRQRNARIVYCSITGYGMSGPYEGKPGYDIIAQGMAGMMPLTGDADSPPMRYAASIADMATGMYGVSAVMAALFVRERTGRGQYLDLSLAESQAAWAAIHAGAYFATGKVPRRLGNAHSSIVPFGPYRAQDGYLTIACGSESLWRQLCDTLDLGESQNDPRYAVNRARVERRDEVRQLIERKLASGTVVDWCKTLEKAGVPCGPINDIPQMLDDDQMKARGFVVELEHPLAGTLRTLACPIHLSDTPATYRLPPPLLGQHTSEVLAELGYSPEEIARWADDGAI